MTFLVKQVVPVITFCEGKNSSNSELKSISENDVLILFINLKALFNLQLIEMRKTTIEIPLKNATKTLNLHPLWKKSICIGNMED